MQINPKLIKNQFEKSMDKYNENAVVQQISAEKLAEQTAIIRKDFEKKMIHKRNNYTYTKG